MRSIRSVLAVAVFFAALTVPIAAHGQVGPPDAAVVTASPAVPSPAIAAPAVQTVAAPVAYTAIDVARLVAQAADTAHGKTGQHLALAGLLAIVLKFILDGLMKITNPTDKVKLALPWICSGLGVPIGILGYYTAGSSVLDSVILGGAAPGAVLANELGNQLRVWLSAKPAVQS